MAILRAVSPDRLKHAAVLEAVKVRPGNAGVAATAEWRPTLTASARVGVGSLRSGRKNARGAGRTKEWTQERKSQHRGNARFLIRGSSQDGQAWPLQPLPPSLRGFRPPFTRPPEPRRTGILWPRTRYWRELLRAVSSTGLA